ncbi:hypothetical protein GIB67_041708, partial [Kingdonia uniflora]
MLENSNVRKDGFQTSVGVVEIAKDGLEMKHFEVTTEREVHRAIDLVGEKDRDVPKLSPSKLDK